MSDLFFRQLGLPKPDVHLEVGSGSQGEQTAKILDALRSVARRGRAAARGRPWWWATSTRTLACGLASGQARHAR